MILILCQLGNEIHMKDGWLAYQGITGRLDFELPIFFFFFSDDFVYLSESVSPLRV